MRRKFRALSLTLYTKQRIEDEATIQEKSRTKDTALPWSKGDNKTVAECGALNFCNGLRVEKCASQPWGACSTARMRQVGGSAVVRRPALLVKEATLARSLLAATAFLAPAPRAAAAPAHQWTARAQLPRPLAPSHSRRRLLCPLLAPQLIILSAPHDNRCCVRKNINNQ